MTKKEKIYCTVCDNMGIKALANILVEISYINQKSKNENIGAVTNRNAVCEKHIFSEPFLCINTMRNTIKEKLDYEIDFPLDYNSYRKKSEHMVNLLMKFEDKKQLNLIKKMRAEGIRV